jgi:hypothetical protein
MSDNVSHHPYRDLMAEAERERELAFSPEGQALAQAIYKALDDYFEFLDRYKRVTTRGVNTKYGARRSPRDQRRCRRHKLTSSSKSSRAGPPMTGRPRASRGRGSSR